MPGALRPAALTGQSCARAITRAIRGGDRTVLAYLALFAAAFLSATIFPGFSEAGVAAMIAGGAAAVPVVATAATGNTLGAVVNWWLGRYLVRFADRRWFPVRPEQIDRARVWFSRYGTWSLLLAWVPVIGDPLTFAAGVLRVRFDLFVLLVGAGKTARYVVVALAAGEVGGD